MSKIAVIYWSGTGNTQQMAEAIANQAHADLFTASEFSPEKAANYDAFAFGCSAMGAEQLEEDEFEPMWNAVAPVLGSKKVVLFGSYGWGGGEWMDIWKRDNAGLNIVDTVICNLDLPPVNLRFSSLNCKKICSKLHRSHFRNTL
ncbi:MAG: flavodoxin domain-containing protein [Faecalibacterium sp.]|nr:flavodoxin domain-containing protein [Faecalibacterium sp.]